MRSFLEDHPGKDIRFKLHSVGGLSSGIIAGLKNKEFDIAFCSKYRDDPLIEYVRIGSQSLVLAVPLDHPLADRESVSLKETLPYPQILFDRRSGLRRIIDDLFVQIKATPACIMEIE
jgi:DNA-binding transcriptional LysR family regulator